MKAEFRLVTVHSSGKQGPGIVILCEDAAEMFALQTIINNGLRLCNYGGNQDILSCLISYQENDVEVVKP